MVGYGVGSLAGSVAASLLVTRLPRVPVMVSGWLVLGTTLVLLPGLAGSLLALAVASAVGGFAMPLGIAALNALITEHTTGADRRTAFAVQHVTTNGGVSLGMLSGGAIIATLGAGTTMQAGGLVQIAVPLLLIARATLVRRWRTDQPSAPDNANGHGRPASTEPSRSRA
jgi:predicted MFS family arabinose efflux permease